MPGEWGRRAPEHRVVVNRVVERDEAIHVSRISDQMVTCRSSDTGPRSAPVSTIAPPVVGQVVPRPGQQNAGPVAEAHQVDEVQPEPRQPTDRSGQRPATGSSSPRRVAADRGHRPLVAVAERPGRGTAGRRGPRLDRRLQGDLRERRWGWRRCRPLRTRRDGRARRSGHRRRSAGTGQFHAEQGGQRRRPHAAVHATVHAGHPLPFGEHDHVLDGLDAPRHR